MYIQLCLYDILGLFFDLKLHPSCDVRKIRLKRSITSFTIHIHWKRHFQKHSDHYSSKNENRIWIRCQYLCSKVSLIYIPSEMFEKAYLLEKQLS